MCSAFFWQNAFSSSHSLIACEAVWQQTGAMLLQRMARPLRDHALLHSFHPRRYNSIKFYELENQTYEKTHAEFYSCPVDAWGSFCA